MKIFSCKCGSTDIFIQDSGNSKGLYCADCGKWMQWLGKDDLRLARRQIEQSIVNPISTAYDVDKVMEELEVLRQQYNDDLGVLYGLSLAESIIRRLSKY